MHPRDEQRFGRRPRHMSDRDLGRSPQGLIGSVAKVMAPYHKWYKIMGTCNTDLCGADGQICNLIGDYAERAMKKGGVEKDDAREFEIALAHILDAPIEKCNLCAKIKVKLDLDKETKTLSGEVVIPCKKHGCLNWEFEIGEGAAGDV